MKIRFKSKYVKSTACVILFRKYNSDDSTSVTLFAEKTGEPIAKVTVCLAYKGKHPKADHIFVKDYSENEGAYQALLDAGIVLLADESFTVDFPGTTVYHARLSPIAIANRDEQFKEEGL